MPGTVGHEPADEHRDVGQRERARKPSPAHAVGVDAALGVDLGRGDELQRDAPALDRVEDLGLRERARRAPRGRRGVGQSVGTGGPGST
jgi:hypothetical protein